LSPNLVFDSERILGISKSSVSYNKNDCWIPAFPYSNEVNLKKMNKDEVKEIQNTQFDGMDPNLVSLYCDYHDVCKPYFERLAYDDEYRKVLEDFHDETCPVILSSGDYEYVTMVLQDRQEAFKRVLSF